MKSKSDRRPERTRNRKEWQKKIYEIIFESDTFYGKLFDEILLVLILLSIAVVMMESISEIRAAYGKVLAGAEWFFTLMFTLEYLLRILCSPEPRKYIFSFLGIVDLLAIIPTYIALVLPEAQPLVVIRGIRLLRIYRILKLYQFVRAGNLLLLGYSIIAIPTGIVSVEISRSLGDRYHKAKKCRYCDEPNHEPLASFCKTCGSRLE